MSLAWNFHGRVQWESKDKVTYPAQNFECKWQILKLNHYLVATSIKSYKYSRAQLFRSSLKSLNGSQVILDTLKTT